MMKTIFVLLFTYERARKGTSFCFNSSYVKNINTEKNRGNTLI